MSDNITIKDANNVSRQIHTIEDSTSAHYNMSVPITVSGATLFDSLPGTVSVHNRVDVSVSPNGLNIPVSIANAINANVSLGASGALIGSVSISPNGLNLPVSVAGGFLNLISTIAAVSLGGSTAVIGNVSVTGTAKAQLWDGGNNVAVALGADNADALPVSGTANRLKILGLNGVFNRNSSSWDLMTGTSIGTFTIPKAQYMVTPPTHADATVSVLQMGSRGSLNVTLAAPDSTGTIGLTNSMADNKANNINRIPTESYGMVFNTATATWDRMAGTSAGLVVQTHAVTQSGTWNVTVNQPIAAGTNLIGAVSVRGNLLGSVSISNIADVSISPAGLNIPVSVANTVNVSANGGRFDVSVSPTQANIPVSIGGLMPKLVANTDKVVIGAVSLAGINQVSVAGAVTVSPLTNTGAAVPAGAFYVAGTDGTNLRGLLTTTGGAVVVHVSNIDPTQAVIGANVNVYGTQMVGSDENGKARTTYVDSMGAQKVGGYRNKNQYQFTRPGDTNIYASGDAINNNTATGSVNPISFKVGRLANGNQSIQVRRATVFKSTAATENAGALRLHIFDQATGCSCTGDNAAIVMSPVSAYCGYLDFPAAALVTTAFKVNLQTGGLCAMWQTQTFNAGSEMNIVLASAQTSISAFLECRGAYTPGNAETYTIILEFTQD